MVGFSDNILSFDMVQCLKPPVDEKIFPLQVFHGDDGRRSVKDRLKPPLRFPKAAERFFKLDIPLGKLTDFFLQRPAHVFKLLGEKFQLASGTNINPVVVIPFADFCRSLNQRCDRLCDSVGDN